MRSITCFFWSNKLHYKITNTHDLSSLFYHCAAKCHESGTEHPLPYNKSMNILLTITTYFRCFWLAAELNTSDLHATALQKKYTQTSIHVWYRCQKPKMPIQKNNAGNPSQTDMHIGCCHLRSCGSSIHSKSIRVTYVPTNFRLLHWRKGNRPAWAQWRWRIWVNFVMNNNCKHDMGPLLLTWINFNPIMDK